MSMKVFQNAQRVCRVSSIVCPGRCGSCGCSSSSCIASDLSPWSALNRQRPNYQPPTVKHMHVSGGIAGLALECPRDPVLHPAKMPAVAGGVSVPTPPASPDLFVGCKRAESKGRAAAGRSSQRNRRSPPQGHHMPTRGGAGAPTPAIGISILGSRGRAGGRGRLRRGCFFLWMT